TAPAEAAPSAKKGEKTALELTLDVENPLLWTLDEPHLYALYTTVSVNGEVTDEAENTFGIRTMTCDVEHGFRLNGVEMKLRGGCIHHDHGALGAASFPAAEAREVRLLKDAGFNSFRIAHNPPSLALLEECDKQGVIVMDEAFDMWNVQKRPSDDALWGADWWERDITAMVKRDRNHPCVLTYSIGNEIIERDGSSDGAEWAEKLVAAIKKEDDTRFVTSGICGMWDRSDPLDPPDYVANSRINFETGERSEAGVEWDKRTFGFMKPLDIIGYNYLYTRYDMDHERYPDRVIWGSETHALRFYDSWSVIMRSPYVLGDYTWTAIDNLGECGAGKMVWARDGYLPGIIMQDYPWRTCFQGDLDLAGFRRPQSYFREAIWIGGKAPYLVTTHPEHTGESYSGTGWHWYDVHYSWTFEDKYVGCPVKVDCYTDADLVKFYVNSIKVGEAKPEKGIASIMAPYAKGSLTAVAYKAGERRPVGRAELHTVGDAAKLLLKAEKETFKADGRDLLYVDITVADQKGDRVPTAGNEIRCKVTSGELLAVFSGEPANEDIYGSDTCHTFDGRAVAVIKT
ncbi:MAG: DUF4982 domain-containing protein, partial [Clostridia bacterium]|nr:DUF4982 domain-containing protein [Clostridia bacterium]